MNESMSRREAIERLAAMAAAAGAFKYDAQDESKSEADLKAEILAAIGTPSLSAQSYVEGHGWITTFVYDNPKLAPCYVATPNKIASLADVGPKQCITYVYSKELLGQS